MNFLRKIRFYIWRWWFLNYKLERIISKAQKELEAEYDVYLFACIVNDVPAKPYHEWCADYVEE